MYTKPAPRIEFGNSPLCNDVAADNAFEKQTGFAGNK